MDTNPEELSSQELTARLAREEQINADLRAKLANWEASHVGAQPSVPVSHVSEPLPAPTMPFTHPVRVSRQPNQRRFSTGRTILLAILALVIGFIGSTFLVSRILVPSPYWGDGYTITPLAGWQIQSDPFGVTFSDPRFPMTLYRYPSQLGVVNNDPLFLEFGSSFRSRCQSIGGVAATTTIAGTVWSQSQYMCVSSQKGGVASLFRILFTTHGATQKYYAIYYLTAIDRLDDFSNGSFATMTRTFTFR